MGSRMMGRQARASIAIMRLWKPHDPGARACSTPSRTTSPTRQTHRTPEPCKESSGTNLVIMGSGVLISSLMAADLIDEYLLMIAPLVLGAGRRLFAGGTQASLRLVDSIATNKGVLIATYEPARG